MATRTKLDLTQYGKRFVCKEHSTAPIKSVLNTPRTVTHTFSIDGEEVDENTFFETHEEDRKRLSLLFERYSHALTTLQLSGNFEVSDLEGIEAELRPEEKKLVADAMVGFQIDTKGVTGDTEEFVAFARLASGLSSMFEQRLVEELTEGVV